MPFTLSQSKLNISFYWDSAIPVLTLKHKNTDTVKLELKCYITEVSKKDKVIYDLKIKLIEKWDKFAAVEKKVEKTEQKVNYYSEH